MEELRAVDVIRMEWVSGGSGERACQGVRSIKVLEGRGKGLLEVLTRGEKSTEPTSPVCLLN